MLDIERRWMWWVVCGGLSADSWWRYLDACEDAASRMTPLHVRAYEAKIWRLTHNAPR